MDGWLDLLVSGCVVLVRNPPLKYIWVPSFPSKFQAQAGYPKTEAPPTHSNVWFSAIAGFLGFVVFLISVSSFAVFLVFWFPGVLGGTSGAKHRLRRPWTQRAAWQSEPFGPPGSAAISACRASRLAPLGRGAAGSREVCLGRLAAKGKSPEGPGDSRGGGGCFCAACLAFFTRLGLQKPLKKFYLWEGISFSEGGFRSKINQPGTNKSALFFLPG